MVQEQQRWPSNYTFQAMIDMLQEEQVPDGIKPILAPYLSQARYIITNRKRETNKNKDVTTNSIQGWWRGSRLEPMEEEVEKAKQLAAVIGISPSIACIIVREYVYYVHAKFRESLASVSLLDLIKFYYMDEFAVYCFTAQVLCICQDEKHALHTFCVETWNQVMEEQRTDETNGCFSSLLLQAIDALFDDGMNWLSKDKTYDSVWDQRDSPNFYYQIVMEYEPYRKLWTLELLLLYYYSHSSSLSSFSQLLSLLIKLCLQIEPQKDWQWQLYLTCVGVLVEVLNLEQITQVKWTKDERRKSETQEVEKEESFSMENFERIEQIWKIASIHKRVLAIPRLAWSIYLYFTYLGRKDSYSSLLNTASLHLTESIADGALETLDELFIRTPCCSSYSIERNIRSRLNSILFGYLQALMVAYVPKQLSLAERTILSRLFANTISHVSPILHHIWYMYQQRENIVYDGFLRLFFQSLALFPLYIHPCCQLLSSMVGGQQVDKNVQNVIHLLEEELPFYATGLNEKDMRNIRFLSWDSFQQESAQDALLTYLGSLDWGPIVTLEDDSQIKEESMTEKRFGIFIDSSSMVIWRQQWNGWKYISSYLKQWLCVLETHNNQKNINEQVLQHSEYDEFLSLIHLIHCLLYCSDSQCIARILYYIEPDDWISLWKAMMYHFLFLEEQQTSQSSFLKKESCIHSIKKVQSILEELGSCMTCFVLSCPTFIPQILYPIEEWIMISFRISKHASLLYPMLQLWTACLHAAGDEWTKEDKEKLYAQVLYFMRRSNFQGSSCIWETKEDLFVYVSCLLCLSQAPCSFLHPLDWLNGLEYFASRCLGNTQSSSDVFHWLSTTQWNTWDWRTSYDDSFIEPFYSLVIYCLLHFLGSLLRDNFHEHSTDFIISLANSSNLIRLLAFAALNGQQCSNTIENTLQHVLYSLQWKASNWPLLLSFLNGTIFIKSQREQHVFMVMGSIMPMATDCLIGLFHWLAVNPTKEPPGVTQVCWPTEEATMTVLANAFLSILGWKKDIGSYVYSTLLVCNSLKDEQRLVARSLLFCSPVPISPEDFLKSKHMDWEWMALIAENLSDLKRRMIEHQIRKGDGIRFFAFISLLKETWFSFGSFWLQEMWEKFGLWKLLLTFTSFSPNILSWLKESCSELKDDKESLQGEAPTMNGILEWDDWSGWLEGITQWMDLIAQEVFECFPKEVGMEEEDEEENNISSYVSLWKRIEKDWDWEGFEQLWYQVNPNHSIDHSSHEFVASQRNISSSWHVWQLLKYYEAWMMEIDNKFYSQNSFHHRLGWYYQNICMLPSVFYRLHLHPYWSLDASCSDNIQRCKYFHRQASRLRAKKDWIRALYRMFFVTSAVWKEKKGRLHSFWRNLGKRLISYLENMKYAPSDMEVIFSQWLLDMCRQSWFVKQLDEVYWQKFILNSLFTAWKYISSHEFIAMISNCANLTGQKWKQYDVLWHLCQQRWEEHRKQIRMHLLYIMASMFGWYFHHQERWLSTDKTIQQGNDIISHLLDAIQEEDFLSSKEWSAANIHAWTCLFCSIPIECFQYQTLSLQKELFQRILVLWKEWIHWMERDREETTSFSGLPTFESNPFAILDSFQLAIIKLTLSIPSGTWKDSVLKNVLEYFAMDTNERAKVQPHVDSSDILLSQMYDIQTQQRNPFHYYWIHRLTGLSLHRFLLDTSHNNIVLQWVATHVAFIESSLELFPIHGRVESGKEERTTGENHLQLSFAKVQQAEEMCALLYSLYRYQTPFFRQHLMEIYQRLLHRLYAYIYQVYRLLKSSSPLEWWVKPVIVPEMEQWKQSPVQSMVMTSPKERTRMESERPLTGEDSISSPFPPSPSLPPPSYPLSSFLLEKRKEISPKKSLGRFTEKKRGYSSLFGQYLWESFSRSLLFAISCIRHACEYDMEDFPLEPDVFLSAHYPSFGLFVAIPMAIFSWRHHPSLMTTDSLKEGRISYVKHIIDDCFLIVWMFGKRYEQREIMTSRWKEEIAKRWLPLVEEWMQEERDGLLEGIEQWLMS